MRTATSIKNTKKISSGGILAVVLVILASCIGIFVAMTNYQVGIFILGGIGGLATVIFCFAYPVFSFYVTLFLLAFISDIARFTNTSFPLGTVTDVFVLITFASILFRKFKTGEYVWSNCNTPIVYVSIIYVTYTAILIFNPESNSLVPAFSILRRVLIGQILLYSSIQIFSDIHAIKRFLKIVLGLGLIIALYGCYEEWFGYPNYELAFIWSDPRLIDLYSLDNGTFRKASFTSSPADFGTLMSGIALICLVLALNIKFNVRKVVPLVACAVLSLLAMSYSGTRTAYFSFATGIFLYILMTLNNLKTLIFSFFAATSFILLLFSPIYSNPTLNRIRSTFKFSNDASMHVRDENRRRIQPYLQAHPFGGGLGSTASATHTGREYQKKEATHPLDNFPSDSGFLRTGLEAGWIGLIILCVLFFVILQQGVHAYYRAAGREEQVILIAVVVALFCQIVSNYAQQAVGVLLGGYFFYPLVAMIIRLSPSQQKSFSKPKIQQP